MTPDSFLLSWAERGGSASVEDAQLILRPKDLLTDEERAFVSANADALARALRPVAPEAQDDSLRTALDLDAVLKAEQEAEERRVMAPPQPLVRFRVPGPFGDQYKPLHRLTTEEVIRLRERGSILDDEVRSWLAMRNAKPTGFLF